MDGQEQGLALYVVDEVGRRLRERRIRMGISVRQLAEEADVDRGRLAKLEAGEPNVRPTTVGKVESTLARLEHEMGMDDADQPASAPGRPGVVEFRVRGKSGADVVASVPVDSLLALEEAVIRILTRVQAEEAEDKRT